MDSSKVQKAFEHAKKHFRDPTFQGPWLVGIIQDGIAEEAARHRASKGAQAANALEARHAQLMTAREFSDCLRCALIEYLQSPVGIHDFDDAVEDLHTAFDESSGE